MCHECLSPAASVRHALTGSTVVGPVDSSELITRALRLIEGVTEQPHLFEDLPGDVVVLVSQVLTEELSKRGFLRKDPQVVVEEYRNLCGDDDCEVC